MEILLIWILGWILLGLSFYIYNVYINRNYNESIKLIIYKSIKFGLWSWFGIIFMIAFGIVMIITSIDNYITEKLNNK